MNIIELDRIQLARLADALDTLIEKHGSRDRARVVLGVSHNVFARGCQRGCLARFSVDSLEPVAKAFDLTIEDLLAGKGPKRTLPRAR